MVEKLPSVQRNPVPIQPIEQPAARESPIYPQSSPAPPINQQPVPPVYSAPPPVMVMAPAAPGPSGQSTPSAIKPVEPEVLLISHSMLFYWWPVWAVGYVLALITMLEGVPIQLGNFTVNVHTSNNLGVLFFLTLFMVILISNLVVRGLASALVIMGIVLMTVTFAYFQWWDAILGWVGELTIFLNQGAYFWFSTLMFIVWTLSTFVFDRMSFWRVRPGQMVHEVVLGASSRSYDTENMTFEKRRDDVFRHWLLGLGSGDLVISAFSGGHPEEIHVPNVLFIGTKIRAIQQMIAMRPAEIEQAAGK